MIQNIDRNKYIMLNYRKKAKLCNVIPPDRALDTQVLCFRNEYFIDFH